MLFNLCFQNKQALSPLYYSQIYTCNIHSKKFKLLPLTVHLSAFPSPSPPSYLSELFCVLKR